KTSIFSHPVYLFLRKFSLQDSRGGSMLYALAAGFLAAASLSPLCEIIFGGVRIFLLKRRMRRENSFREGNNDAVH
ncbi:hypothetical protein ACTZFW_24915, partial [Escherichia coli]